MQDLKEEEENFCQELFAIDTYDIHKWKQFFFKYPKLEYHAPQTAIYYAVLFNKYETVQMLLCYCPKMLSNRCSNRDSLVHTAAKMGHLHIVQLLLDHNQELIHTTNDSAQDVLFEAVENQKTEVVSFLLKQHTRCKNSLHCRLSQINEALELATKKGYFEIVKLFLHWFPVFTKQHFYEEFGASSYLEIAISKGNQDLVSFFGEKCSRQMWCEELRDRTLPVIQAVKCSSLDMISIVCKHTVYELLSPKSKEKLLIACVEKNDVSVFVLVTNHYSQLLSDSEAQIATYLLTIVKDYHIAKKIFQQCPSRLTKSVFSLEKKNDDCFYFFVSQRPDLYWSYVEDKQPKMFATKNNKQRCVEVLKKFPKRCSTLTTAAKGNSVLHLISMSEFRCVDCAFFLDTCRPLIHHINFENQTPHDVAMQHENKNMLVAMEPYVSVDKVIAARKNFWPDKVQDFVNVVHIELQYACQNLILDMRKMILDYIFA